MQKVIIIGAGFAGLRAAKTLAGKKVDVLLIDQQNYHCFQPLLYQVATAGLEPEQIAYPVRGIMHNWPGVRFLMARVEQIDRASKHVVTTMGSFDYDYLIVAAGGQTNYFGNREIEQHSFGLKNLNDAEQLRNHLLSMFERAAYERDPQVRQALHTFVVVGGGPTGVELAGAIRELVKHVLVRDFPQLENSQVQVILLEATDKVLGMLPTRLQQKTLQRLEKMGVQVRLNTAVEGASADQVYLKGGEVIASHTLIWAAGVRGVELAQSLELALARGNRVQVQPDLRLADDPNVFVVGDLAYLEQAGKPLPQVAPVAIQQAVTAAKNILQQRQNQPTQTFIYRDRGSMATIGRNAAVAHIFGLQFWGFPAWVVWLFIHLMSLVGFRNRLVVLINWAYNYFFYDQAIRLITANRKQADFDVAPALDIMQTNN
ncbi:MAG TPA: NAD(P)/FAD-dependent oxidoreductase [Herpetosiphon sp.]|uniref:NADH:ubiquinone reductase (non-electrogenic) n=1 Tax=Herpetosiphon aurantiacus (strain ATCC 23779 / DSM 785 / 114-95) TaxID=316274 RepID=A9AZE1_HERA2|nr:NAD(P)/FAD-dependent oxidoreductase [Herpetosiphon sp.]ABX05085.1 FAD-dependent pyridine nucleotide-disulphide oxidoreductase [Herpetosiphon aurantiacus DSM 785]HBW48474.1 NAD(P)/FAD-dependent oxidoreductase [Herpetosiphon sp.]